MQDAIHALLDQPDVEHESPVSTVAVRIPDGRPNRVTDILRLMEGRPTVDNASPYEVMADLERERRQLHHALAMLKVARQRLHEQHIEHRREQERTVQKLRRKWEAREGRLAMQIAKAAMQKARDELAEDRARLEADFERRELDWQQQRREAEREWQEKSALQRADLESARRQLEESIRAQREELQNREIALQERQLTAPADDDRDDRQRRGQLQQQLAEARRKAVEAELAVVEQRAQRTAERRAWNDERTKAEAVIRDLIAELDSLRARETAQAA
ncbi:MAG: hypothetical protein ACE5KM_15625 [Planctomycetaceae bacterium]